MLKIVRSISRAILVAGVIPIIFRVLKFQVLKYAEGSSFVFGWVNLDNLRMDYLHPAGPEILLTPLLVIAVLSALYVARILFLLKGLRTMDYIIPSILFAVIFYILFYLRALMRKLTTGNLNHKVSLPAFAPLIFDCLSLKIGSFVGNMEHLMQIYGPYFRCRNDKIQSHEIPIRLLILLAFIAVSVFTVSGQDDAYTQLFR
jgi:hypothetical protein